MKKLTENHFSFKCPMNWDEMQVSDNSRFCGKCRKEVFDLTNCSIDEVIALQRKHGAICGSIRLAAVAISLSTAACQNGPTGGERTTGMVPPRETSNESLENGDRVIGKALSGPPLSPERLEKMKEE